MDRKFWKLQGPSWSLPPGAMPLLPFFALTLRKRLCRHSGHSEQGLARAAGARMRAGVMGS